MGVVVDPVVVHAPSEVVEEGLDDLVGVFGQLGKVVEHW